MNLRSLVFAALVGGLALAGCNRSTTVPTTDESGAGAMGADDGGMSGTSTMGAGGAGGMSGTADDPGARDPLLSELVVYFDYDRSEIRPEFNELLAAHATYLAERPTTQVRLEGHSDERGSREYNIGLGERRAQAVRRVLLLQGAATDQISTVSYGEERPAVLGSDEQSYGQNRRVEIVYR
jgi:peptidoglycan-associated lipoprotein